MSASSAIVGTSGKSSESKGGKYLTFALGQEEYGFEILKVREIIGYLQITAVPQLPPHIKGVINLRGQVIPVLDLRARFELPASEPTDQTCIVVVEIKKEGRKHCVGMIVDRVSEVVSIADGDIEPTPEFGSNVETEFTLGIGKVGTSIKILLDADKVLAAFAGPPSMQMRTASPPAGMN